MSALLAARFLVRFVRFRHWRGLLGRISAGTERGQQLATASWHDHYCARVVERAAQHLPFEMLCLPRAMALKWMLGRRRRPAELVLAVLPGEKRGGNLDDLHAWVSVGDTILIGDTGLAYHEIARFVKV